MDSSENGTTPGYVLVLNWHVRKPGGVSHVVSNLGAELAKLGWAPAILVNDWMAKEPETDFTLANPVVSWRVRSPWDATNPWRNLIAYLLHFPGSVRTWLRLARRQGWLVVNCHFPDAGAGFWVALRALGLWKGAVILSVHGNEVRSALASKNRIERTLVRKALAGADAVVACSSGLGADVIALAPEARERLRIIPNGVDFDALKSCVDPDFALPPALNEQPFILNVAKYEPKKAHETLIKAFAAAAARHENLHLVVIGRAASFTERIRECAAASGFVERIHLLVDLTHAEVINWLSRATVFCLPSISEGHPLVLMEAAAFELPVVVTDIGGTQEIVARTDEGLLVPASDHEALASALIRLVEEPEAARRLGRNLRQSVEARYSWTKTAKLYSELAQSLLTSRVNSSKSD